MDVMATAEDEGDSGTAALQVTDLRVSFGGLRAVDGLSFRVGAGQIVALIGANGAGKTTALNCISGFIRPTHGSITAWGHELARLPPHARAGLGVSRTFQHLELFGALTALENVLAAMHTRLPTRLYHDLLWWPARRHERAATASAMALLARLGLEGVARRRADTLSLGRQKLLAVARCLAVGARLLLLDEPAAGLTHQEALALGMVLRSLPDWYGERRAAVLLVEHNMGLVMRLADRVVVMDRGRAIAQGTPDDVRRSPAVIAAYLGTVAADG